MRSFATIATLLAVASITDSAFAEGGYYAGVLGARASGRAGAVAASADDLTAVSSNPAGLAKLGRDVIQLGNIFSYNAYNYTRVANDYANLDAQTGQPRRIQFRTVSNSQPWQALDPFLGIASNFGRHDMEFALAAYAPPGIGKLAFPQTGGDKLSDGQRYMMVSREATILKYAASVAWKYHDVLGIGVSAEWIQVPRLRYSLVIDGSVFPKTANPVSSGYDILASTSGSSLFSFNATVGAWVRPAPFLEIGFSGQLVPTDIVANSSLSVTPLGSAIGKVSLVRGADQADDVSVTLPLPMLFRGGIRYRDMAGAREIFDLELDVEYETWSRVNQFRVETRGLRAVSQSETIDLGTIAIDKHWRDTIAVRLGGDYAVLPGRLTLRGGGYYESAVADPAYANVDFPSGAQVGAAVGASIFLGSLELALAYHARVQPSFFTPEAGARVYQQVPGSPCTAPYTNTDNCNANYLGQPAPAVNAGTYGAVSQSLAFDVIFRH